MEKEYIAQQFKGCIHCSQVVISQWAEKMGFDKDTLMKMVAPLAGGYFESEVCGCVSAALLVIGYYYGHCKPGDIEGNNRMVEMANKFKTMFREENGTIMCKGLQGRDFSIEGELDKAFASGELFEKCPDFVNSALEILDELIEE